MNISAVLTEARGAGVTGSYGPTDMGAANPTFILWKSSKHSQLLIISPASNPIFHSSSRMVSLAASIALHASIPSFFFFPFFPPSFLSGFVMESHCLALTHLTLTM